MCARNTLTDGVTVARLMDSPGLRELSSWMKEHSVDEFPNHFNVMDNNSPAAPRPQDNLSRRLRK